MTGVAGSRSLLGNDFYWLAHDDDGSGRARLRPRVAGLGSAAALLGELVFTDAISLRHGRVVASDAVPDDPLTATVHAEIAGDGQHGVRVWLDALGVTAVEWTAVRLQQQGQLRRIRLRRGLRRSTLDVPTDINAAALPWSVLSNRLWRGDPLSAHDAYLVGLAGATGLSSYLLEGASGTAHAYARDVVDGLPDLAQHLVLHTEAAVGDAVLAYRA